MLFIWSRFWLESQIWSLILFVARFGRLRFMNRLSFSSYGLIIFNFVLPPLFLLGDVIKSLLNSDGIAFEALNVCSKIHSFVLIGGRTQSLMLIIYLSVLMIKMFIQFWFVTVCSLRYSQIGKWGKFGDNMNHRLFLTSLKYCDIVFVYVVVKRFYLSWKAVSQDQSDQQLLESCVGWGTELYTQDPAAVLALVSLLNNIYYLFPFCDHDDAEIVNGDGAGSFDRWGWCMKFW